MRAAVMYGADRPLVVEEVQVLPPQRGEVLVRLGASGVCHSDYHALIGEWTVALPTVLGHEGAGVVEEVGPEVSEVQPGDHVILSWAPNCRRCFYCAMGRPALCELMARTAAISLMFDGTSRLRIGDQPVYQFAGVASFGEYAVVPESGAIPIRKDMPLEGAALIGCGVATGVGAVINTARVEAGSSVLVIGCGGVGLSCVQGAVLSSAEPLIAVDLLDSKLEQARRLGATHTLNPSRDDVLGTVRALTGGRGVDYAFEAIGLTPTIEQAYEAIRPGGTAVVVGQVPEGHRISIDPYVMSDREKVLKGSNYGSCRPSIDFPKFVDLYLAGKLKLDEMISRTIKLDEINAAFDAMMNGEVVRSVIRYGA